MPDVESYRFRCLIAFARAASSRTFLCRTCSANFFVAASPLTNVPRKVVFGGAGPCVLPSPNFTSKLIAISSTTSKFIFPALLSGKILAIVVTSVLNATCDLNSWKFRTVLRVPDSKSVAKSSDEVLWEFLRRCSCVYCIQVFYWGWFCLYRRNSRHRLLSLQENCSIFVTGWENWYKNTSWL